MKKVYFIALLLLSTQAFSQYVSSGIGRWRLGLNIGATWQTADVSTDLFDLGYGATLEYAVYQKQSSFFGFSLRGRFLQGKTTGYDYLTHQGIISNNAINGTLDTSVNYSFNPLYLNNKTSLNEFSLEAMLKWNRLYQNHGILFYLYLGGGFTNYKVETDQLGLNGDLYDYSFINGNNGATTVNEIKNLQDGIYETELSNPDYNTLVFTPAVGVGLGFRLAPGLDFAMEHKISLPQTDLFDGQIHPSSDPSFIKDIYHYTSLGLIFSIVKHDDPVTYIPPDDPVVPVTPITNTPVKPVITLTQPITNTFNTPNCKVEIIAKIEHVVQQKDIDFYHNGNKVPSYKYFFTPSTFKSTIDLSEGNNTFKIVAKNGTYSDTKEFSLQCNNVNTITICHKNNDGTSSALHIKENEWASHAAHGDTKGACPENQITICHLIVGGAGKTETISIPESSWAIHKSHGDQMGSCQEKKMITICHNNQAISIDEKDWAQHAAHGDTKGACPQVNMITICHKPETGDKRITMSIPENEWIVHQAHGDFKGTCPPIEPVITICHKNNDGSKSTMNIPEFRWVEHFSHGDSKGACPQTSFIICHKDPATGKKSNISIYESGWPAHAAHGDTKGACPVEEKQITICHKIPGQIGKTETITIPESQWLIHKSHGDQMGACVPMIQICHHSGAIKTNITIPETEWFQHASHGDTKGTCPIPEKKMTICHKVGNTKSTIVINASEWPTHAAHGDSQGTCPPEDKQITICHKIPGKAGATQTITIMESQWLIHKSHGDELGPCPVVDNTIQICHKSGNTQTTIFIKESEWPSHAAHGDSKGICPKGTDPSDPKGTGSGTGGTGTNNDPKITICHYPPGNTTNPQTIQINQSAWPAHAAHGDSQGICPKNTDPSDPKDPGSGTGNSGGGHSGTGNSGDTGNSGNGGHSGSSGGGSNKITICHYPNGANSTPETIEIDESAWKAHQAHGDTVGGCASKDSKNLQKGDTKGGKGASLIKGKKP